MFLIGPSLNQSGGFLTLHTGGDRLRKAITFLEKGGNLLLRKDRSVEDF